MEKSAHLSANNAKASLYGLSGYFKLDLPTGELKLCAGKTHICQCGKSQNEPLCDGSHAKCVDGMVPPWF
jgi:hypothetical protein